MIKQSGNRWKRRERGVSLVLVGLGLLVLLGAVGLAVDLATLYVARNEAQRAADAAALAGAREFAQDNMANGLMAPSEVAPLATAQAAQVGNHNLIIGRSPDISPTTYTMTCSTMPTNVSEACFNFSTITDPQITVRVYKKMPTYFMRAFGVDSVPVSVTATAEAYTPQGSGPTTSVQCLKPWLLPNCDPAYLDTDATEGSPGPADNANCAAYSSPANQTGFLGYYNYFVYPPGSPNAGQLVHPGLKPDGSIGEQLTIKPGNPTSNDLSSASKFWPVFLPSDGTFTCPNCASSDQQNSTSNSAALYRENIECCSDTTVTCGQHSVDPMSGDMTGPTGQGVDCLIHETTSGTGQDTISLGSSLTVPFTMYSGTNNPYKADQPPGSVITQSDSEITMPLYDGKVLCPGNSCPSTVTVDIVGFLQLFIVDEGPPQHTVTAFLMSISSCNGETSTTGTTPIPAVQGTPIPIRLINNGSGS